jgi:pimeloyl-ACP methyl ester carboxylesterase
MFIKVNNRMTNTYSFGSGQPALVAHGGFAGSSELWLQPFETLSRRWQVVTFDHRGSGENPAAPEEISQDELVSDLMGVMDALELQTAVLAGESMGAGIALRAVLEHPSRFLGLVLVDGSPVSKAQPPGGFPDQLRKDFANAMRGFVDRCFNEKDVDHLRRWGLDILMRSTPEASARLIECMWGLDLVDRLPEIDQPTLVIHGRDDAVVPHSAGELMAARIPHSRLAIIEGCGHVPTMTFPSEVVDELTSFMEEVADLAPRHGGAENAPAVS